MTAVIGIRANAGAFVGFGHVRRCVSLAEALLERGAEVVFFTNPESNAGTWVPRYGTRVARIESVPADEAVTLATTLKRSKILGLAALVADSYDISSDAMASMPMPVVAIVDAPPATPLPAALVVNSAADAASMPHPLRKGSRALLGPQFAMLRREFTVRRIRRVSAEIASVLVLAGGSDPTGLSLVFVEAVRSVLPHSVITVVVGPYFPETVAAALRAHAAADPLLTLVSTPSSIRELMDGCDVALTGGGQTTYELAAAGVPACAVRVALNQTANLEGLQARRTLLWAGDIGDHDVKAKVMHALEQLSTDMTLRASMSEAGQVTVDGRGAGRVADAILELCA